MSAEHNKSNSGMLLLAGVGAVGYWLYSKGMLSGILGPTPTVNVQTQTQTPTPTPLGPPVKSTPGTPATAPAATTGSQAQAYAGYYSAQTPVAGTPYLINSGGFASDPAVGVPQNQIDQLKAQVASDPGSVAMFAGKAAMGIPRYESIASQLGMKFTVDEWNYYRTAQGAPDYTDAGGLWDKLRAQGSITIWDYLAAVTAAGLDPTSGARTITPPVSAGSGINGISMTNDAWGSY